MWKINKFMRCHDISPKDHANWGIYAGWRNRPDKPHACADLSTYTVLLGSNIVLLREITSVTRLIRLQFMFYVGDDA